MKKILSLIISLVVCFSVIVGFSGCESPQGQKIEGQELVSSTTPYVKWEGRYAFFEEDGEEPARVTTYHSATGFTIDFTGTELYVEFYSEISGNNVNHHPYYNVAVDNEIIPTVAPERTFKLTGGKERICVVSGLSNARHTVKCLKMSEPYDATVSFLSFETNGSFHKRDAYVDNGSLRFMFICASGGSGHGALGTGGGRTTANSSALHSFNYLTARMFGADVQYVGNSGWGVSFPTNKSVYDVLDYTGITTNNNVSKAKTTPLWNHQQWVPDVIIYNIGGNDTTASGFNQTTYSQEVVAMVQKMHNLYPNAYMIWTHTKSNAGAYAMAGLTDAGIVTAGYLKEVIIPKVGADGTVGANNHNSLNTHITTAQILADALANNWGFTPLEENVKLEDYSSVIK
ncbi:MAG: hypothetical protein IKW33_02235 [Clostridia bacterium]|nr:hypothetical protein [Clostridia bacterium]